MLVLSAAQRPCRRRRMPICVYFIYSATCSENIPKAGSLACYFIFGTINCGGVPTGDKGVPLPECVDLVGNVLIGLEEEAIASNHGLLHGDCTLRQTRENGRWVSDWSGKKTRDAWAVAHRAMSGAQQLSVEKRARGRERDLLRDLADGPGES